MEGGPSDFPQGSSCLVVLWILSRLRKFLLLDSHHLRLTFPNHSNILDESLTQSLTPVVFLHLVWALPLSLAATYRIDFSFFSCGYLDVSVPHVSLPYTIDSYMDTWSYSTKQVSPFGYPRISSYLPIPVASRSLSRPSSALGA